MLKETLMGCRLSGVSSNEGTHKSQLNLLIIAFNCTTLPYPIEFLRLNNSSFLLSSAKEMGRRYDALLKEIDKRNQLLLETVHTRKKLVLIIFYCSYLYRISKEFI